MKAIDVSKIPPEVYNLENYKNFKQKLWSYYVQLPEVDKFMKEMIEIKDEDEMTMRKARLKGMFKHAASTAFEAINKREDETLEKQIVKTKEKINKTEKKTKKQKGPSESEIQQFEVKFEEQVKTAKFEAKKKKQKGKRKKRKAFKAKAVKPQTFESLLYLDEMSRTDYSTLKYLHGLDMEVDTAIAKEEELFTKSGELREWLTWKGHQTQKSMKNELEELFEEKMLDNASLDKISVPKISKETKDEWLEKMKDEQDMRFAIHRIEWDCKFNRKTLSNPKLYSAASKVLTESKSVWRWRPELFTMKKYERAKAPPYRTAHQHQKWVLGYGKKYKQKKIQSKTFGYQVAQMKCRQYLLQEAFKKRIERVLSKNKIDDLEFEKRMVYNTTFGKHCLELSETEMSWSCKQKTWRDAESKQYQERQIKEQLLSLKNKKKKKKKGGKKKKKRKKKKGKKKERAQDPEH